MQGSFWDRSSASETVKPLNISLFGGFAHSGHGMLSALVLLGFVFSVLTFLWLTFYAVTIARVGQFVHGSWVGRAIDGTAGMVLIALGLKVATEERY